MKDCKEHDWSKWTEVSVGMIFNVGRLFKPEWKQATQQFQRRVCSVCGKIEEEPI